MQRTIRRQMKFVTVTDVTDRIYPQINLHGPKARNILAYGQRCGPVQTEALPLHVQPPKFDVGLFRV